MSFSNRLCCSITPSSPKKVTPCLARSARTPLALSPSSEVRPVTLWVCRARPGRLVGDGSDWLGLPAHEGALAVVAFARACEFFARRRRICDEREKYPGVCRVVAARDGRARVSGRGKGESGAQGRGQQSGRVAGRQPEVG